jgi:hypothetical protein
MKRLWMIPLAAIAVMVPAAVVLAATGGNAFDGVVDSIESQYHVRATRIPLMGLASMIANKATGGGVSRVHVAEFEHFDAAVDGEELNRMVERKLGTGWERIIRETSKRGKEQTLIFARDEGNHVGMFIVDKDGGELNVVEVSVDPDHLSETIAKYDHGHDDGDGNGASD